MTVFNTGIALLIGLGMGLLLGFMLRDHKDDDDEYP